MATGLVNLLWAVLFLLFYLLVAAVAVAASLGVPAYVGKMVYDRAESEDLSNPAAIGVGAAFFTVLIGLFAIGVLLVYVG